MKKYRFLMLAAASAFLGGCASDSPKEVDFHTPGAKNPADRLEVPPDLTGLSNGNKYFIPAGSGAVRASQLKDPLRDHLTNMSILPKVENMHIEREGAERWLKIDEQTPEDIWPLLQDFWEENGFVIAKNESNIGFMETEWAENRAAIPQDFLRNFFQKVGLGGMYSSSMRDKFIIRVERAKNGSIVTFSHKGMEEVFVGKHKESTTWKPRERDPDLEAQMLARFMMKLGADKDVIEKELSKQDPSDAMASLQNDGVHLSGNYERNIHRVKLALDRIGLTVQRQEEGVFLVQPAEPESQAVSNAKPGFFSRMFGSEEPKKAEPKPPMIVRALQTAENQCVVTLHHRDGSPYQEQDAKAILKRLYAELR